MVPRRILPIGCIVALLVLGGCLGAASAGEPAGSSTPTHTTTATSTPTATTTVTPTPTPTASATNCPNSVAFYGLDSPGETAWEPNRVAIGYTVPGNASVFFVAFEDGTVIGSTHVTTRDLEYGITADGDGIPLEEPLNGSHVIRVGAYRDTNGNGAFDFGTDMPCRSDGEPIEAGPRRIDFGSIDFDGGQDANKTDS